MNISGVEIGKGHPCRTVFEISNSHNGDYERAVALIDAAKDAGADFVKFQAYTPQELVELRGDGPAPDPWGARGWSMRDLYEKAQTPLNWLPGLVAHCRDIGMPWFSSVFGVGSLAVLESLNCPAYKLAALDHSKRRLLWMVRGTGKPIIRSCASQHRPPGNDTALYCPPGYPQTPTSLLRPLKRYDGLSYHGTDPSVPALAAALDARMVECHVQLDDEPSELESNVCLSMTQFAEMVRQIRATEAWV